jgi:hypothetical protein
VGIDWEGLPDRPVAGDDSWPGGPRTAVRATADRLLCCPFVQDLAVVDGGFRAAVSASRASSGQVGADLAARAQLRGTGWTGPETCRRKSPYLIAPCSSALTKLRWKTRNTSRDGAMISSEPAHSSAVLVPY